MYQSKSFMEKFLKERPVGTENNNQAISLVESYLKEMGYSTKSLHFDCLVWEKSTSSITLDDQVFNIEASPFSLPFRGNGFIYFADTLEKLRESDCGGGILILSNDITKSAVSPKNYPFYFPDEDRELIALLENKNPAAIIAVTGKSPIHGKVPFPFFEDGKFLIPSANIDHSVYDQIFSLFSKGINKADLVIESQKIPSRSRQVIASKKAENSKGKIIIAAHMDTKYDTIGALDNGVGIAVLLDVASKLSITSYDVDIVPFNSEEYFGANGELEYLKLVNYENIAIMINIDSPCQKDSKIAVSFYNFSDEIQSIADKIMSSNSRVIKGDEWYAGDHAPFLFRGIPTIAVTSENLFDTGVEYIHTEKDTMDIIDMELVEISAQYIVDFISEFSTIAK